MVLFENVEDTGEVQQGNHEMQGVQHEGCCNVGERDAAGKEMRQDTKAGGNARCEGVGLLEERGRRGFIR